MIDIALVIFAAAAVGGLFLGMSHLKKGSAPLGVAAVHGLVAAAGLVVLVFAVVQGQTAGMYLTATALFAAAALGGFVLLAQHLQDKPLKQGIIAGHGLVAVTAFVVLLYARFG